MCYNVIFEALCRHVRDELVGYVTVMLTHNRNEVKVKHMGRVKFNILIWVYFC
jgi:hypothetical protein